MNEQASKDGVWNEAIAAAAAAVRASADADPPSEDFYQGLMGAVETIEALKRVAIP